MNSRMEKYYEEQAKFKRTTRNANLYKEVYGNYANLENLPIADNTNEIDIKDLKEIVNATQRRNQNSEENITFKEVTEEPKEEREYDINKILEKAKSTRLPKEAPKKNLSPTYKFLSTLESQEIPISNIEETKQEHKEKKIEEITEENEEIYMTRELKFHDKQLEVTKEINLMKIKESSPLDLFEDLKPDGNSFIAEPVKPEKDSIFATIPKEDEEEVKIKKIKKDNQEDIIDNEDIDIIKKETFRDAPNIDDDFYTNSYKFSKRDFIDEEDDFYDKPKKGSGIIKVILLLIAIFALTTIIYYFINKYGVGI